MGKFTQLLLSSINTSQDSRGHWQYSHDRTTTYEYRHETQTNHHRASQDPSLDSGDFIVGYEDRFAGAMEKALDTWKSEQTDEEFIPQHRILYFKRRSDNIIVWERRTRTDLLFGSGGGRRGGSSST